ncbi:hypothetical protein [Streptomyces sp. T028]|uniref:hypothetical protein n=1 Tax=Streptomyces sp. T028 TaxID=3394379 RepID=UPI003A8AA988
MHITPRPRRAGARIAALAALTVAGSALTGAHAFAATDGDIKIHDIRTDQDRLENDPHVCEFYLAASNFDPEEAGGATWTIVTQPPSTGSAGADGTLTIGADGTGQSESIILPAGHYMLSFLTADGDGGPGKQKTFWVDDCPTGSPSPTGSQSPTGSPSPTGTPTTQPPTTQAPTTKAPHGYPGGPHGGPPAGGGGLARDAAFGPVAGAAAVGVAAVGGVVWFRLRRRPHGAA